MAQTPAQRAQKLQALAKLAKTQVHPDLWQFLEALLAEVLQWLASSGTTATAAPATPPQPAVRTQAKPAATFVFGK